MTFQNIVEIIVLGCKHKIYAMSYIMTPFENSKNGLRNLRSHETMWEQDWAGKK